MLRVIAIGGGGFTHESDPELDNFVLAQSPVSSPRLGYIGAANGDDPVRIERFYRRFDGHTRNTSHLPCGTALDAAREWISAQDIIYVGGGNTTHLLHEWRDSGIAEVLCAAGRRGTLLAGVSAGAVCWFEFALSDSAGNGLQPLTGLGLIPGSCCPHYSTEPHRQGAFRDLIAAGALPDGIAIDDGVAVLLEPGQPATAFAARRGAWACLVRRRGDFASTDRLAAAE